VIELEFAEEPVLLRAAERRVLPYLEEAGRQIELRHQVAAVPVARQAMEHGAVRGEHEELQVVRAGAVGRIDCLAARLVLPGDAGVLFLADVVHAADEVVFEHGEGRFL